MPVAPETVQVFADAIEAQRQIALDGFDRAAVHLDDIRARLRFAVGDPVPIDAAISTFAETAVEGGRAFQLMLNLVNDLWRVSQAERKPLPRPVDLVTHMDDLVDRMARTATGPSFAARTTSRSRSRSRSRRRSTFTITRTSTTIATGTRARRTLIR